MTKASTLLAVEGLTKSYGGVHAVRGVSFSLAAGEILALIGPNGAGKSTCFNMLNGQIAPDSGTIHLLGRNTTGKTPRAIWRLGVGRTFQITATLASMTVRENVQVPLVSYNAQLFNMWDSTPKFARVTPTGPAANWPMAISSGLNLPLLSPISRNFFSWTSRLRAWRRASVSN